ncbi:molybdenum ABC transporter ATP-binding protein [Roseobacter sp. HKCC-CH-9208]|uniref:molybdenum ABC transporter ATP-binding protein n=1 Tax=Roseobacter sp. HKCC-CH-9208 TaxID=3120339 RepID=UPI0030EE08D1
MLDLRLRHQIGAFSLDLDFQAARGITALFGRSGAGKTTVINAVAGLITPDDGYIRVGDMDLFDPARGINLAAHERQAGYIFQEARLFPHLSVAKNLRYGMRYRGARPAPNFADIVEMLGIGHLLQRRPAMLSGGEKQRVAIGRALLAAPRILLADEPLAALDESRKQEILPYFERLRDEMDIPILYVSHAPTEVARLATEVITIEAGRIQAQGHPSEVFSDPHSLPAGSREAGAVIEATLTAHHADGVSELRNADVALFVPRLSGDLGRKLQLRIAAHEVILATQKPQGLSALNVIEGTIHSMRSGDGPAVLVAVDTKLGRILARVTRRSAHLLGLNEGRAVYAILKTLSVAREDIG